MTRTIARFLLWISGWKVDKIIPPETERCVMIAAPHTSNWDAYFLRLAFWVLRIPMKVAIKDDWTKFPFGMVVTPLGGVGIDRSPKEGTERLSQVEGMIKLFVEYERIALVIAPEGTRKKRDRWKLGFYWVAKGANVPLTFGYLDYKNKIAGVGPKPLYPGENVHKDMQEILDFYSGIEGRNRDQFGLDNRYTLPENNGSPEA